jgi:two-component system, chemotaxis family, protein-glutamate methylesterase/glutaminase
VIKLLVVDDSALMRKLLEETFVAEGDFEVRLARNAAEALDLVRSFDPHVVTLDVQMPGMDGLACLSRIMLELPRPVVMISALTADGAEATLEAIELGAIDFVTKPSGTVSLEIDRLRPLLIEKVRGAVQAKIRRSLRLTERIRHQYGGSTPGPAARPLRRALPAGERNPHAGEREPEPGVVLIGTSTGGPPALDFVLSQLPAVFPWPVMIAQHMPRNFTGPFARRLDRQCAIRVVEVDRPMPLQAGTAYIGRGDADLVLTRRASGAVAMSVPSQRDYPWHPSVERLVTSALEHYDPFRLIGVLLTGMGNDGAAAMTRLRRLGGRTIAEAQSTAVVWGMPGELVRMGGAEMVRPIEEVAAAVIDWIERHAVR